MRGGENINESGHLKLNSIGGAIDSSPHAAVPHHMQAVSSNIATLFIVARRDVRPLATGSQKKRRADRQITRRWPKGARLGAAVRSLSCQIKLWIYKRCAISLSVCLRFRIVLTGVATLFEKERDDVLIPCCNRGEMHAAGWGAESECAFSAPASCSPPRWCRRPPCRR